MISIRNLRKEYDDLVALENLSFDVPGGECFGLIGPNGAGKTTLLRILSTLLEPTYGTALIHGYDVQKQPLHVHRCIGYMSDVFAVYEEMQTAEYLDHFARCYGITNFTEREKLIDEVLSLVSLTEKKNVEVKGLSRGMRQRLCLAKTLLHQPKVLLLDEPASGMDPAARVEFREILKQLRDMGRTILISSHILTEMADFCSSVAIIERGQLLASGKVTDILAKMQTGYRLEVEVLEGLSEVRDRLSKFEQASLLETEGSILRCKWSGEKNQLADVHRQLVLLDAVQVLSFTVKSDNLEDLYMRISGHRTS